MTDTSTAQDPATARPTRGGAPQPPRGHGSPAGELLPSDQPATTTGPTRDAIAQWQTDAPGRAVTKPAPVLGGGPKKRAAAAQAPDAAKPHGVGPGSRDTPPPTGDAATAAATQASREPPVHAAAGGKGATAKVAPGDSRPPRPAQAQKPAAAVPSVPSAPPAAASSAAHDELVEAITRRLADNLAKALRQSVVEAVQGVAGAPRPPDASDVPAGQAAQAHVAGGEPKETQAKA